MKIILPSLFFFAGLIAITSASHVTPKIKGDPSSETGKTDNPAVRCILKENWNPDHTVRGELIVDKKFVSAKFGPNLAAWKDDELVFSLGIEGREKDGKIHYYFMINRSLLNSARFDFFTNDDGMFELHLSTVRVLKNDDKDPFGGSPNEAEQGGTDQPATAPESKSGGEEKTKPKSEARSQ